MNNILAITRKEFRQIVRDLRTLMILGFVPALFLLVFGYALNFDVKHIQLAVEDRDGSSESRALVSAFVNSGYFDMAAAVHDPPRGQPADLWPVDELHPVALPWRTAQGAYR